MKILPQLSLVGILLFAGCVTQPPRITNTPSGKPEVAIATNDVARIKSMIIGDLVNHGYTVEQDTEYSLTLSRRLSGGEDMVAALAVGNSYSSNTRLATYTFVRDGNSVRVILAAQIRAQMPGGQVKSQPLDGNNSIFNTFQQQLLEFKKKIEAPAPNDAKKPENA